MIIQTMCNLCVRHTMSHRTRRNVIIDIASSDSSLQKKLHFRPLDSNSSLTLKRISFTFFQRYVCEESIQKLKEGENILKYESREQCTIVIYITVSV